MNAVSPIVGAASVAPHRLIQLSDTFDLVAIVDEVDYLWATQWRWNYNWHRRKGSAGDLYARRNVGENRTTVYLHREIMIRAEPPPGILFELEHVVDHINGCTLDARRCNLRWATKSVNGRNTIRHRPALSLEQVLAALPPPLDWPIPF